MRWLSLNKTFVARCASVFVVVALALLVSGHLGPWQRTAYAREISQESPSPPQAPQPEGSRPKVAIQAGHWKSGELPKELASLRNSTGAKGNGWAEVDVNLDIARRVVAALQQANVDVDLLPATVPANYKADAFVALHCDANNDRTLSGYKLAYSSWSSIPGRDSALLNAISSEYRAATGLPEQIRTITPAMRMYYAFNQRLQHSVDPSTPAVILEMGFLTNDNDLKLLTQQQDTVAQAIANGILKALAR